MQRRMGPVGMRMQTPISQLPSASTSYKMSPSKIKELKWMEVKMTSCGSEHRLGFEVVKYVVDIFKAPNPNTNLVKCSRWWKERRQIINASEHTLSLIHTQVGSRNHVDRLN